MAVKTSVIAAVASMETVDLSIIRLAFPASFVHDAQKVEFDVYEGGQEIALKGNFEKESNVVEKDGYSTVTVNPMQINEVITDAVVNVNKKRVGESIYGDKNGLSAAKQAEIENDAKGYGKLKKRYQRLLKNAAYDVLVTGKVTVSQDGVVTDEIDYGLTNKVVNDNATAGIYQWNDTTNSDPINQLESYAIGMGQFAVNTFVIGDEARKAFIKHPKVMTSDNTTTGKKASFFLPTLAEREAKSTDTLLFIGTTAGDYGKSIEIYADIDEYGSSTKYLDKNYAVGFSRGNEDNGQLQYGNIPIATGEGSNVQLETFVGTEWIDGEIKKDPAGIKRYFRSSPLPTMNQPKAFVSIKATLI